MCVGGGGQDRVRFLVARQRQVRLHVYGGVWRGMCPLENLKDFETFILNSCNLVNTPGEYVGQNSFHFVYISIKTMFIPLFPLLSVFPFPFPFSFHFCFSSRFSVFLLSLLSFPSLFPSLSLLPFFSTFTSFFFPFPLRSFPDFFSSSRFLVFGHSPPPFPTYWLHPCLLIALGVH